MEKQIENEIVAGVLQRLAEEGYLTGKPKVTGEIRKMMEKGISAVASGEAPVTLGQSDAIGVDDSHNPEILKVMRKATPARILLGRAGARPRTKSYLQFQADHAAAVDAVFKDVSTEFQQANGLIEVRTMAQDKDEFLMKPDLGKRLSEEAKKTIGDRIEKGRQVQIIVVDGLSSTSIEANGADVMAALIQGLKNEGLSVGTPFFVKYGRVGVMDDIAPLVNCEVIVELIGERPGLITAESMSAYMAYRPNHKTVEAERTVISNIHRGGTPPAEAGAHLATIVRKMVDHKASGVALAKLVQ